MPNDTLLMERKENVCTLIFNRPEKRNALSPDMLIELYQVLEELSGDDAIRCVVIRGTGEKVFSAGYDIGALPTKVTPELQEQLQRQNPLELATEAVLNYPYPVIAMLNGYALGAGCELAICCDIRVGAKGIRMGMPPAKLGIVYNPKGILRFIQVIGVSKTKELFLTGRSYEGFRLKEMGLVDYLVPRGELESFTYELAGEIAGNAPLALKGTKRIINMWMSTMRLSDEQQREAQQLMTEAFNSEDLKEGQRAFLEKRKPRFQGR